MVSREKEKQFWDQNVLLDVITVSKYNSNFMQFCRTIPEERSCRHNNPSLLQTGHTAKNSRYKANVLDKHLC